MKKAGIITLFGEYNYGNRLQNYATQEVLKKFGLNVETIKYMLSNYKEPDTTSRIEQNRLAKFKEFNKNIKFADQILYMDIDAPKGLGDKFDYIAIGSDQIWNYSFPRSFSHRAFGSFAPKEKRFSIAASFGVDYFPEKNSEIYNICQKYLKELKAISVREDAGKIIGEKLTNRKDIEVLIDPTMMLTKEEWEKIMKKPENLKTDKFIVKNFLGNISEIREEELIRFAKENECEIIDISDKNSPFFDIGPAEFLYLEKNAILVATDSFHACVFSILFSTPFLVFERQDKLASMYSRIETLVNKFEIGNRVFNGKIENEILNCDYTRAYTILEEERKKANGFLEKALQ